MKFKEFQDNWKPCDTVNVDPHMTGAAIFKKKTSKNLWPKISLKLSLKENNSYAVSGSRAAEKQP